MKKTNTNILFTSVGRRSYLVKYFKKALGEKGEIHAANSSKISPAFLYADHTVITPLIYNDEYIPFLLDYCRNNQIRAIISLFDVDLPILSKNKNLFEKQGIKVIVSNQDIIDICNDKWKTFNFLKNNGFNVPKTYIDLKNVRLELANNTLAFPLILKPRWGMGSIGIYQADNEIELEILYNKIKREIMDTYLKYESSIDVENSVLIQEKLQGKEYGIDIINDLEGNYRNTICKLKYAMRSGETDCAMTVYNEELKSLGEQISGKLHHIANLDVDIFEHGNQFYVLEMNARFGGGYPFSHQAGVNLPLAIIKWLTGEKVSKELLEYKENVVCQKDIEIVELDV